MADPNPQPIVPTVDFSAIRDEATGFEDEGLFARDVDGQLIRVEKADQRDFDQIVSLTIDGRAVKIPKAVPLQDAQGNIIRDNDGAPKPRYTTIFDAANQEFVKQPGDRNPIPTLCHQEHLPPVGVCRVCVVEAMEQTSRGERRQLVPACVQRVSEGMVVSTLESAVDPEAANRVKAAASTIVELLSADHLPKTNGASLVPPEIAGPGNELAFLADRLGIKQSRFQDDVSNRGQDGSGQIIAVDHDQCILCGRCSRGCNWLKGNNIIGRSGKGYASLISFDFAEGMGESECVSCGECAVSCPTGALEFHKSFIEQQRSQVANETRVEHGREISTEDFLTPEELLSVETAHGRLFAGLPYKFLQFNASSVFRRRLKPGDVLCREGEYGASAFILLSGRYEVFLGSSGGAIRTAKASGLRGFFQGLRTIVQPQRGSATLGDVGAARIGKDDRITLGREDLILGEMSCMNRYPRSATVQAIEGGEVLEIRRNVLHMLQRNEVSREILNRVYRERSLMGQLKNLPIFSGLSEVVRESAAEYLQAGDHAKIVFVDPKQTIIAEGDRAENFYIVKLGFVKVSQSYGRSDRVLDYLGPGRYFGEIGLLSRMSGEGLGGKSTASCSALDHVELIQIGFDVFADLMERFPEVRSALQSRADELLRRDKEADERLRRMDTDDAIEQGLYGAHNLLVLDLERCTRCDECTKACADTHDGVTRLVREGLRFDRFLVASACRSCMDPYCLVGCPVDAIHREGKTLQIEIEDYCIGCGLCAQNCPYGNINMHQLPKQDTKVGTVEQRATTCDLCHSIDGKPSCVYACPHEAAFRMTGEEFLRQVQSSAEPTR